MDRPPLLHRAGDLARAWWRAAFTLDARGLAAFRIGLGLILVADCLLRFRTFHLMFAADGVFPPDVLRSFQGTPAKWSLALLSDATWWGAAILAAEGLAGAWLASGFRSREASVAAWLVTVSVVRRTEPATNAGDSLLLCLLFWSMFLPLNTAWSLRARGRTRPASAVLSVASAALVLQVAAVYFGAGLAKCNATWFSGDAVSYALSVHDHGNSLGMLLSRVHWLSRAITWLILSSELLGPLVLVLVPTATARATVATAFILFHLAVWATMWVGLFAPVGIVAWLPMLPTGAWNAMTGLRKHTAAPPLGRLASLACSVAFGLAVVSFLHGLGCLGPSPLPAALRQAILAAGLEQDWPMFGTIPRQEQWAYGAATLADGRVVDLLRQGRPLQRERPDGGFTAMGTHRWHKLFWVLPRADCRVFAAPTAAALARDWNARHAPRDEVRSLQLRFAMRRVEHGQEALHDMLLAAWPSRGDGGRGNLERLLDSADHIADETVAPRR
ncbi:MAG: HTTM domain-containing protein [Planctomycetes bacterium]|nr:HTTM domain-containing protein [Planctomycetota bacterium]